MINLTWRKSSFSSATGTCVEIAQHDEALLVRNSIHPEAGTLTVDRGPFAAWLVATRDGALDDLT